MILSQFFPVFALKILIRVRLITVQFGIIALSAQRWPIFVILSNICSVQRKKELTKQTFVYLTFSQFCYICVNSVTQNIYRIKIDQFRYWIGKIVYHAIFIYRFEVPCEMYILSYLMLSNTPSIKILHCQIEYFISFYMNEMTMKLNC